MPIPSNFVALASKTKAEVQAKAVVQAKAEVQAKAVVKSPKANVKSETEMAETTFYDLTNNSAAILLATVYLSTAGICHCRRASYL